MLGGEAGKAADGQQQYPSEEHKAIPAANSHQQLEYYTIMLDKEKHQSSVDSFLNEVLFKI